MHKKLMIPITIFLMLFLLVAASFPVWGNPQDNSFPITLVDVLNTEVTLLKKPERIISITPHATEIIFALGLEDRLVGRSEFCNYPPEVEKIENIGLMSPLNLEKIISLKPDLILAYGGYQAKEIPRLRELGLKVIVTEPASLSEALAVMELIAAVCGVPERGKELTSDLQERINLITTQSAAMAETERLKIFTGSSDETIWSPGKGTIFHELITLAGGQNIVGNLEGWVPISAELVAQAEPDIIIISSGIMSPQETDKMKNDVINHPGWSQIPAVKNNHIFTVNEDLFYREGPRLVEGLELLYEIFTQVKEQ